MKSIETPQVFSHTNKTTNQTSNHTKKKKRKRKTSSSSSSSMATGKTYYQRPSHHFLPTDRSYHVAADSGFEFDESDLYSDKLVKSGRTGTKQSSRPSPVTLTTVSSLPMNVPDWSKILRDENRHIRRRSMENDDDECINGGRLPPHEYLARTRMASFSVHEGFGRTLKGRDLSRVRNAVFEKTGVLD